MYRIFFLVLVSIAIFCLTVNPAQAIGIPMVYNNTTSEVLVAWDMEGSWDMGEEIGVVDGAATVGSAWWYPEGQAEIVTASSQGIPNREGTHILKSNRQIGGLGGAEFRWPDKEPGESDTTTTTLSLYLRSDSYCTLNAGTDSGPGVGVIDVSSVYFTGLGEVLYYGASDWEPTGLSANINAWNDVVLTHTNGTYDWTIEVNGSSSSFSTTYNGQFTPNPLGIVKVWSIQNAFYPNHPFYMDAVPATDLLPGDTNYDGVVDDVDAATLAANWQNQGRWWHGNFTDDEIVDDKDATILAANWQTSTAGGNASVPEPSTLVLLCLGLFTLPALVRNKRK